MCRYREARTLLRWLGPGDLRGLRVLDVAGGDGYWAGRARGRGARAVALTLLGIGLAKGIFDLVVHPLRFAVNTVLIFVTGLIIASLALLADLIVRSRGDV